MFALKNKARTPVSDLLHQRHAIWHSRRGAIFCNTLQMTDQFECKNIFFFFKYLSYVLYNFSEKLWDWPNFVSRMILGNYNKWYRNEGLLYDKNINKIHPMVCIQCTAVGQIFSLIDCGSKRRCTFCVIIIIKIPPTVQVQFRKFLS